MKAELILHIGAGKCGSSSLQTYLSQNTTHLSTNGIVYEYVAPGRNGAPIRRQSITKHAAENPYGYSSYPPLGKNGENLKTLLKAANTLRAMRNNGIIPIISCEGWINESEKFTETRILEEIGLQADVVMYIRPPLDWLNSAYWQWGAWTNASFERWFINAHSGVFWDMYAEKWSIVPNVKNVTLRLATGNIIEDFTNFISCQPVKRGQSSNSGSSGDFLRFLQRNRSFRPDPHSPVTEFMFNKYVVEKSSNTPWVIDENFQDFLFKCLGNRYQSLEKYLSSDDWKKVKNDSRWWDKSSYSDRKIETPSVINDIKGADRLISQLVKMIISR